MTEKRQWAEREFRFERHMSDAEALMWNIEKDPWLNPSGATVAFLDRAIDPDRFRAKIALAVSEIPRLRQRAVTGVGRISPPEWRTDPELDLDYHIRHLSLPAPGSRRQLLDLATRLYEDPYDRTRPLWMFVLVDGLSTGEGALFVKMHHTLMDGIGAVRLSEAYMELERDEPTAPDVDLAAVIASDLADEGEEMDSSGEPSFSESLSQTAVRLSKRYGGVVRRAAAEVSLWGADPQRAVDTSARLLDEARSALGELTTDEDEGESGSPLWRSRSRGRHIELVQVPLDDTKRAAKQLNGSVNDVFLTVMAEAARRYHAARRTEVDEYNATFVVSTRNDSDVGGNSFTPTKIKLPGGDLSTADRFELVRERARARRADVSGEGSFSTLAGVANLFPTSVVTRLARSQAGAIDFATSNLRAAPFTVFISGAKLTEIYPIGPVAGTAANITMMSYNGQLHLGIFSDPAAIDDPVELSEAIQAGFDAVLAAGEAGEAS